MTVTQRIRHLCDENEITMRELERRLGYSNGSVMKSDKLPIDRAIAIADLFGVSVEYLATGKERDMSVAGILGKMATSRKYSDFIKKFSELDADKQNTVMKIVELL